MPELHGTLTPPGTVKEVPCAWCGAPTDLYFAPAGGSRIGPQPLHILCGAAFIRAYDRLRAGRTLGARDDARMRRLTAHAATSG